MFCLCLTPLLSTKKAFIWRLPVGHRGVSCHLVTFPPVALLEVPIEPASMKMIEGRYC